jgi:hypothetical protein
LLVLSSFAAAQSSDQNFPTPLTTNEVQGTIKARDMGDARLTTYFFAFDGGQGDIFINAVTQNFSGDIDVFTADAMLPLAKMVMYSDSSASETGRLIYLRKPEKLLLRVQGRTPNDDAATYRVKFGGSFIALAPQKEIEEPTVAATDPTTPGVKVNDAGKIVAVVTKPKPTPKPEPPKVEPAEAEVVSGPPPTKPKPPPAGEERTGGTEVAKSSEPAPAKAKPAPKETSDVRTVFENPKAKVVVGSAAKTTPKKAPPKKPAATPKTAPAKAATTATAKAEPAEKPVDPLASVRLVIQMKDGTTFWMPMNEVLKFTVDKGIMTVVKKDGGITRYNILDVEKTTIQ